MYVARLQPDILAELQDWTTLAESHTEGSFEHDIFATNAIEFAKIELELQDAYQAAFGQHSYEEYLEMRAAEHGIIRRSATKSKGQITVTGNGTIHAGAIFATQNNIKFIAVTDTAVVNSATIDVEAQVAGANGNVDAGTIKKMPLSIAGINSVTNSMPTTDGYDEETDEELRDRYLTTVRYPATSGNPQHYSNWALEVSGVGAASVIRCWNGAGTVKVIIADSEFKAPSNELIQRVYDHIETRRPIGAILTVSPAEQVNIDISANITGNINLDNFRAYCTTYFKRLMLYRFVDYTAIDAYSQASFLPAGSVSRSILGDLILKSGASDYDYDSMRLNSLPIDISLNVEQVPQLGNITFHQTING